MLTYEQLKPLLYRYASYHPEIEPNELVNEIWARNRVQHLPDIKMSHQQIKWEMAAIFRRINGRNYKKSERLCFCEIPDNIPAANDFLQKIIAKDQLYVIKRRTPAEDWEIIERHYIGGDTMTELAKARNCTTAGMSWKIKEALSKIRKELSKRKERP